MAGIKEAARALAGRLWRRSMAMGKPWLTAAAGRVRPYRDWICRIADRAVFSCTRQRNVLYAFHDHSLAAPDFSIVNFLVAAEAARIKQGVPDLHVVMVPGPEQRFRRGDLRDYNQEGDAKCYEYDYIGWRIRNILVPCCWLLPSCRQVTVCASREEARSLHRALAVHVFPAGYTVQEPIPCYRMIHLLKSIDGGKVPSIHATPQSLAYMVKWIGEHARGRKVVTLTLRETFYHPERNSSILEWIAFARQMDPAVYLPVFIRDSERALEPVPEWLQAFVWLPEVSWNIEFRSALYELSYLNLMINNGPGILCIYNSKARFLIFKMVTPSVYVTSEDFLKSDGFEIGGQFPWFTPFQRIVWEDDRLEVLQRQFCEMCRRIEQAGSVGY